MISTNVKDTFSILIEAGYLFKFKDIVWQPLDDDLSFDGDSDEESEAEQYMAFSKNRSNSRSSYTHKYADSELSGNFDKNR